MKTANRQLGKVVTWKDFSSIWFADRLIAPLWRYYAQEVGRPIRFETDDAFSIGKACLLICLGELRHYKVKLDIVHPEFKELLLANSLVSYLDIETRRIFYEEIIKSELLDIIPERLVHTCIVGFLGKWAPNFGGLPWYMVAKSIRDLFQSPNKKRLEHLLYRTHNNKYFLDKVDKIFPDSSSYHSYRLCYIILTAGREWPEFFRKYNVDDILNFNFSRKDVEYLHSIPFRKNCNVKIVEEDEKYYWKYYTTFQAGRRKEVENDQRKN